MQGLYARHAIRSNERGIMKRLKHISNVYNSWRDADPALEGILPRNSGVAFEDQDCRSYTLHVAKEGLTEVELKLKGLMGIESTFTAPRSIFREHIL